MKKVLEYLGRFLGSSQGNRFFLSKSLRGLSSGKSLSYFNLIVLTKRSVWYRPKTQHPLQEKGGATCGVCWSDSSGAGEEIYPELREAGYTAESVAKHMPGFPQKVPRTWSVFQEYASKASRTKASQPPHSTYVSGENKLKWALDTNDLSVTTTKPSEA